MIIVKHKLKPKHRDISSCQKTGFDWQIYTKHQILVIIIFLDVVWYCTLSWLFSQLLIEYVWHHVGHCWSCSPSSVKSDKVFVIPLVCCTNLLILTIDAVKDKQKMRKWWGVPSTRNWEHIVFKFSYIID